MVADGWIVVLLRASCHKQPPIVKQRVARAKEVRGEGGRCGATYLTGQTVVQPRVVNVVVIELDIVVLAAAEVDDMPRGNEGSVRRKNLRLPPF
jgi:hypothetical protein